DHADQPVDADCIYHLLTWSSGEFEFVACLVEGVDRVNVSTTHLLMEGARLIDEADDPDPGAAVATIPPVEDQSPTDDGWD
ncbi:MAG TPA: DUF4388 domain-containing protein, partial [Kofleriaceae bacterium]